MYKGLVKFDWNEINNFSEEDITYFLSLEGKDIEAICRIRNLTREEVQRHIIEGKIKYRFLAKSKDTKQLFETLCSMAKEDKLSLLKSLDDDNIEKLEQFIRDNYGNMISKSKENAVWILGELKSSSSLDILKKALVHNHVNIRRMAVSAMGKIGDKSLEDALIRALDDANPQVILYAIKSLMKIKSKKAFGKIKSIYENASKEYLKRGAEEYIKSFKGESGDKCEVKQ